jgi:hypothetical protein
MLRALRALIKVQLGMRRVAMLWTVLALPSGGGGYG